MTLSSFCEGIGCLGEGLTGLSLGEGGGKFLLSVVFSGEFVISFLLKWFCMLVELGELCVMVKFCMDRYPIFS